MKTQEGGGVVPHVKTQEGGEVVPHVKTQEGGVVPHVKTQEGGGDGCPTCEDAGRGGGRLSHM